MSGLTSLSEGQSATYSLAGVSDLSSVDAGSLRYSFALSSTGLATSYTSAGTSNSFSTTFTDNGTYTVFGRVFDKDGGTNTYSTTVAVSNVAPSSLNLNLSALSINENGSTTLSGSFGDPSPLDTHTVAIDWGDGSANTLLNLGPGVLTIPASIHQYLDDNASDLHTISVTVTDDDGGSVSGSTSVTVQNVAPQVNLSLSASTINENDSTTLSGSFVDPGTLDMHTITINWGDGSPNTVLNLGPGVLTIPATSHQFLDDNSSDLYIIDVTVNDDDGGTNSETVPVTVNNVPPQNVNGGEHQTVNEGDTVNLIGSFTDPGTADTHTQSWSVVATNGQVVPAGTGSAFSFAPLDDGTYSVTYSVTDDDGDATNDNVTITAHNVAPTANPDTASTDEDTSVTTDVTANDTDPGTKDVQTVTSASITMGLGSVSFAGGNVTLDPGTAYNFLAVGETATVVIEYAISDGHSGSASSLLTVTVIGTNDGPTAVNDNAMTAGDDASVTIHVLANDTDPDTSDVLVVSGFTQPHNGSLVLNADGTFSYTPGIGCECSSDSFEYMIRDGHGGTSHATVTIAIGQHNAVSTVGGIVRVGGTGGADVITVSGNNLIVNGVAHSLVGVAEVRIWGRDGTDTIDIGGLAMKSVIVGGKGNEILTGGSAEDLIFGGMGDDTITGGAGNDFLIGGLGKDRLVGSSGHDVLAPGDLDCDLDLATLRAFSQQWADSHTSATAETFAEALDEALIDGDFDQLTGSAGADLFLIGDGDKITDFQFGKPNTNKDGDVVLKNGVYTS